MKGAVLCVLVLALMATLGDCYYYRRRYHRLPHIRPIYVLPPRQVRPRYLQPTYVEPAYVQPTYAQQEAPEAPEGPAYPATYPATYRRRTYPGAVPRSHSSSTAYGPGATASSTASNAMQQR